ncbi:MAG TPA: SAM-dependent DNA methyltransferase [Armatimonadetes bacterium]|nr:SAM-dependent DNA methyltransferase [Armatimonadota bacterium]
MGKKQRNSKKQLAQYFTPPAIVDFMYDLVDFDPLWKVIDPACGEGVFLLKALQRGAAAVVGVDIDSTAIQQAEALLAGYGNRVHLFCQDGLAEIQSENAFWRGYYDLVIGNPPFTASRYRVRDPAVLERFEVAYQELPDESLTLNLFGEDVTVRRRRKKASQVIEVLFLERFIQLAKPGGKVAIILPEGIFANFNLRYVREWLVKNFTARAVVALPRETFKATGTTAKTCILYLEKSPAPPNHQVLLAEVSQLNLDGEENPELETIASVMRERGAT